MPTPCVVSTTQQTTQSTTQAAAQTATPKRKNNKNKILFWACACARVCAKFGQALGAFFARARKMRRAFSAHRLGGRSPLADRSRLAPRRPLSTVSTPPPAPPEIGLFMCLQVTFLLFCVVCSWESVIFAASNC